jgi:hypothetical protein
MLLFSGLLGLVLISPIVLASWFLLPRRWLLVWPYWMTVALLLFLWRGGDAWFIELPGGMRVVMIDTMDRGWLEGPNGFSVEVTKIGVVGDRVIYREGDGPLEPLATVHARQRTWWPEAICAALALAPFILYLTKRLTAPKPQLTLLADTSKASAAANADGDPAT